MIFGQHTLAVGRGAWAATAPARPAHARPAPEVPRAPLSLSLSLSLSL